MWTAFAAFVTKLNVFGRSFGAAKAMLAAILIVCASLRPASAEVQAKDPNIIVAPFEVLENHPRCSGNGKIAYRVQFATTQVKARFGITGEERPAECSVRVNKAGRVDEISIPCSASEAAATREANAKKVVGAFNLPKTVSVSGSMVGCMGVTSNAFVEGSWNLSADTALGRFEQKVGLEDPNLSTAFKGPSSRDMADQTRVDEGTPAIVLAFDKIEANQLIEGDVRFNLSTFVVISPTELWNKLCKPDGTCRKLSPADAGFIASGVGLISHHDLPAYVGAE